MASDGFLNLIPCQDTAKETEETETLFLVSGGTRSDGYVSVKCILYAISADEYLNW